MIGAKAEDMPSDRFKPLSPTVYVPNVIAIADAVLGKIGYGFVSECIRAGMSCHSFAMLPAKLIHIRNDA